MTEAYLPEHRERLYPPTVTLSMFMKQALSADRSCQRAVNAWAAQRTCRRPERAEHSHGRLLQSAAAFAGLQMVTALTRMTVNLLSRTRNAGWRWRGREVKLADGTGISMPDTPENQALLSATAQSSQGGRAFRWPGLSG